MLRMPAVVRPFNGPTLGDLLLPTGGLVSGRQEDKRLGGSGGNGQKTEHVRRRRGVGQTKGETKTGTKMKLNTEKMM